MLQSHILFWIFFFILLIDFLNFGVMFYTIGKIMSMLVDDQA